MNSHGQDIFGADPANVQWQVVRGDTASIRIEFYDDDETPFDTSSWTFSASTYEPRSDTIDQLEVTSGNGYVDIVATPETTSLWGAGYLATVAELPFDLQVVIDSETTWTPVRGTIKVLSDVTGNVL